MNQEEDSKAERSDAAAAQIDGEALAREEIFYRQPSGRRGEAPAEDSGTIASSAGLESASVSMLAESAEAEPADAIASASANRSEQEPPSARGELLLGPLGSHPIGGLLRQYQLAMEHADFESLSRLVGRELSEELRERFPGLFESEQQHRVDLSILQSQRDGDQWVIRLQQEVGVSAIDRRARRFSNRAEFRFRPDPDAIRIVAMEF